ncbi:VIT family protein [Sphingomonas sp. 1P06PA]|uniref:VIT1/CCC1 transporter family protein n=1 Tax=Sphingomonas sp. 1P06PA TaxID=554121 RepID=UPI0039A6ACEA
MSRLGGHAERHLIARIGWLRAAVLGADDGIVSTASLIIGVAAAAGRPSDSLIAGSAGLVAGAMSMAAGEYVSVSSQADTERADIARERRELATDPEGEVRELAGLYEARGVSPDTAAAVARQLMATDALGAHARDELGIAPHGSARPIQAALASAASFTVGAALPLAIVVIAPGSALMPTIAIASLLLLALLGAIGAGVGGAPIGRAAVRVTVWGTIAMVATALIGRLVGAVV